MAMRNFNRIIDINLVGKSDSGGVFIKCPRKGRKPSIEISGQMATQDEAASFAVKIRNLYDDRILSDLSQVQVTAGYEESPMLVFSGTPFNVYTATAGADRETVIQCSTVNFSQWTETTVKLALNEGFSLGDAVAQINNALGFDEPVIAEGLFGKASKTRWDFSRTAHEALHVLTRKFFPEASARIANNRIVITEKGKADQSARRFDIPFLSCAPQVSGGMVSIVCPWNPEILPNDMVSFSSNFYQNDASEATGISLKSKTEIKVLSIQFLFGTVSGDNKMTIQGTIGGGK